MGNSAGAISDNRYRFSGKEEQDFAGLELLDFGARMYDPVVGRWTTQDPLAEQYYAFSPYNYVLGNPIRLVDPFGLDIYRYDDMTGDLFLHQFTDDGFDQIGKFEYDEEVGTYVLRRRRNGKPRIRMDNIEKGILSDGMNFMTKDNLWKIGGKGQPTVEGFQNFVVNFADMIHKEVAGFTLSSSKTPEIESYFFMGKYENNTSTKSFYGSPWRLRPDLIGSVQPHTAWHAHPANVRDDMRLQPSGLRDGGGDIKFKNNALKAPLSQRPLYFMILTQGYAPIYY